ncbi:X-Pro aminopeptidase [Methylobacterium variabile]|uniref:X-Pro aminopeptidase n=1 Tax=Methylobacterium variabile TaxID=298794 RepID=A0A0J6TA49_9HYPH|nr:aminopeptidase P family protein [Methylobacterium variabile]KMO42468.1 X-Pro aminopeptidase [Methylobacterium variabile]
MSQTARFQSFEDPSHREGAARVAALRAAMAQRGFAGFVVPRADEHQSEYVPPNAERLAWLTGFTGSAGTAIVLADRAALVVDGRYTLQAAEQVDTGVITPVPLAETSVEAWIEANLPAGGVLAYDPWLHTPDGLTRLDRAAKAAGGRLAPTPLNLVDLVWIDRPAAPRAPVVLHPETLAGEAAAAKLGRVREALTKARLDALVVSDPHNLAWAFNLRGGDVAHTPLPLGYAVIPREGRPRLFLDPEKVTPEAATALEGLADRDEPASLPAALEALGSAKARVRLDAATGAVALKERIETAGGAVDVGPDPITAMKAVKNEAEIAGARAAHLRDGAAVTRFLAWLAREAPGGAVSEIDAVVRLEGFRAKANDLREIAFPTISGSGPNGAIVHYRVTRDTDRRVQPGELFLIDSGAQYGDGTTDITRTVAVGTPSPEMRDRFTRVLKGHIAIATAVFPRGTTGAQIDAFARRPLWEAGLDFDHGTGHGVGAFLSVHEGPQRIAKTGTVALQPGMIVSNEPGYYKARAFGIRIENLVLVEPREVAGGERPMLGFETLTLAPIDLALVAPELLTPAEAAWLDAYHARVREALAGLVDPETRAWLIAATRPVGG